ncbi:hypothetical protein A6X21_07265 [Planctopirus hydrillae]|uniref:Aspartate/glutamate/uridylate kinase domain-containing protein n=2 Tax=Planctopirus hydrillae TaxID=1841610 RepID=A0A1C3E978_9PLAN|nr:hypothetical protein A6X21_07265 [Planctopirus hydrillae]
MLLEYRSKMLVVIKVGGSLYDYEHLREVLASIRSWFQPGKAYSDGSPLLIPGGGATADVIRDWQKQHHIEEEAAHWLACESLELNARLIQSLLPESCLVDQLEQSLEAWREGLFPVLRTSRALQLAESSLKDGLQPEPLPHHWDVTSDSIAAWFACRWQARYLLLCKSIPVPDKVPVLEASRSGIVDPYFPGLAGYIPQIDWCYARQLPCHSTPWLQQGYPVS